MLPVFNFIINIPKSNKIAINNLQPSDPSQSELTDTQIIELYVSLQIVYQIAVELNCDNSVVLMYQYAVVIYLYEVIFWFEECSRPYLLFVLCMFNTPE